MSRVSIHPLAALVAVAAMLPPLAQADAAAEAVAIDIRKAEVSVDEAHLRAAITDELHRARAPRGRTDCRLAVDFLAADQAQVSWTCAGEGVTRIVRLPDRPEDKIQTIALLAGNLARDEASELIATMPAAAPGETQAAIAASTEPPARTLSFSLGLVPPVSTDLLFGSGPFVHGISVNAVVGASAGIDGVAVSGLADIRSRSVRGGQIAGAVAITSGEVRGFQIAGAGSVAGSVHGAQISGAINVATEVRGAQVSGALGAAGPVDGAQISGALSTARSVEGAQISGAVSIAGPVDGAQISGAVNIATRVHGAQLGVINIASDPRGLQLGVINVAGTPDGIPVGLFSFVKGGPVRFDAWLESSGLSAIAVRHGSRRWHNIYAVGTTSFDDEPRPLYGIGLGAHTELSPQMDMDIDAMTWAAVGQGYGSQLSMLNQFRLTLIAHLGPLALFGGAAANVYVSEYDQGDKLVPKLDRRYDVEGTIVRIWPTLHAGLRFD